MAFRSKSAERVLDELTFLAKRYETSYVQFVDNILDIRYFKSLIPELANRKHGLRIFYETKSNLKKDQVRLLSDAGIRDIQPGIESLNTQVLKLMRKGVTALQNIQFLKWCEQYGVKAEWNLIYGFPGENAEAYRQILQILQSVTHFPAPTAVGAIRMDRFSPNFQEASSRGFTNLRPMLPYRYVYPFSSEELLRLCYYFDFDYADGRRPEEYTEEIVEFWYTWRKATGGKRRLQHFVLEDQAYIEDKRFTRTCDRVHLDNIQNSIVIFCDTMRTLEQIQSHLTSSFPERAFEAKRIQAFLNYLIEQQAHGARGSSVPEYRATAGKRFRRPFGRDRVAIKTRDSTPKRITIGGSSMNEKKITGVRVFILTVDSETNTVLKCEEEDPNTGHRTELDPNFKLVPAQYPAPQTAIPAGFVPSIVILVGGQPVRWTYVHHFHPTNA